MRRTWIAAVLAVCGFALGACGGGADAPVPEGSDECADLPAAPTTSIRFDVRPDDLTEDLMAETATVVCTRLDLLDVQARVEPADSEIVVTMGALDPDADLAERVAAPARLAIYDWEGSLLADRGFASRAAAERHAEKREEPAVVVEDPEAGEFHVLRDEPALTGADITGAKQGVDPPTREPSIGLGFTDEGGAKFEELTRAAARRGGSFAIVVDGKMLARPTVDAATDPDGLEADEGLLITGGMSVDEARALSAFLETDGLPAGVELVPAEPDRSG